ncbi:Small subunit ribosomal protein S1 [Alteracholeplasma palmae J233]|uniref:Small subunit ribosomal protein S1 n=1 Tax=Alteracholeplasma palmae (strain ATCC 49389 / J233) TaxID=1318466 RepID=U4KKL7_ALTPJ|nr:S1 RNA-binding domain-containing protein [Alteracholeplasma palmae]CCV64304.1 Small subunit ribosomal protein S1 [Alteracholeplasma palmae J233]
MTDIKTPKKGQIIEAPVVKVDKNVIYLDVQYITEGTIYLNEYDLPAPETFKGLVKVGDIVRAKIMKISEGDDSTQILLSRLPLIKEEKLQTIEEDFKKQNVISTKVKDVLEKGLVLNYHGYELFLPYSLMDFDLTEKKDTLKNTKLDVVIAEFKEKPRLKLIATRKPIYEQARQEAYEKRQELRQEELDKIQTGDVLTGTVEKLESHAASIKFDHVMGMLRISQISHFRIENINEVLKVGQEVTVKVIKKEGNRLDLSMKALLKTPFENYVLENKKGQTVKGTVVQKLPFGIIVEVAKDVKGLLHKSEYAWNPADNFDSYIKIGDEIEVVILNVDKKQERLQLSKKALENNPWKDISLKRGDEVEVIVTEITKDGLKVGYEGIDGLIPTNELAMEKVNPDEAFNVNDRVKAIVTDFNKNQWILTLSIKKLEEALEKASYEKYLNEDEELENITLGDLFEDFKK